MSRQPDRQADVVEGFFWHGILLLLLALTHNFVCTGVNKKFDLILYGCEQKIDT